MVFNRIIHLDWKKYPPVIWAVTLLSVGQINAYLRSKFQQLISSLDFSYFTAFYNLFVEPFEESDHGYTIFDVTITKTLQENIQKNVQTLQHFWMYLIEIAIIIKKNKYTQKGWICQLSSFLTANCQRVKTQTSNWPVISILWRKSIKIGELEIEKCFLLYFIKKINKPIANLI